MSADKMMNDTLNIRISSKMLSRLKEIGQSEGRTVSEIIRQQIQEFIERKMNKEVS